MGRLERVKRLYLSARRWLPLTDLGVLVLGLALLAFLGYGRPRSDYIVQVLSAAAAALVALALLVVLVGAWRVHARTRRGASAAPLRLEARRGFARGDPWPRIPWLPLVEVDVSARNPPGLELSAEGGRERFEAEHRTAAERVWRCFRVEDAFGLAEVRFDRSEARAVEVGPWLGALDRAPALTALAPGESRPHPRGQPRGDRVEMRPYVRGDPLRLVLWKVYARTGNLVVRTAERALDEETEVHAFLVAAAGDEASAAAAHVAVTRGLLGARWRFGAPGLGEGTDEPELAARAIARSRVLRGEPGAELRVFLSAARQIGGARVVLFTPCRPGPWLDVTLAAVRGLEGRVTAVVAHDGVAEPEAAGAWLARPPAAREDDDAIPSSEDLEAVVAGLARAGIERLVLDRPSGRGGAPERRAVA